MFKYQLPIIQEQRAIKSAREIFYITKAQKISEAVLQDVLRKLKLGVTEISLAKFIVASFKRYGIKALAFEPIVSFGKNTANIHHEPGKARFKKGDTAMFDFGCTVNGYCSDMTRTYFYGEPTKKQKRVYLAVLKTQEKVLQALSQGEWRADKLDAMARNFLTKKFGKKAFPHGLGHGVGTVIHEWPNLKPQTHDVLKPGMVITIEPGVYLKGWGGVRIEDMVLITNSGCKNLTRVPKTLAGAIKPV
jgi:Xaa-Pro aminopeptidase